MDLSLRCSLIQLQWLNGTWHRAVTKQILVKWMSASQWLPTILFLLCKIQKSVFLHYDGLAHFLRQLSCTTTTIFLSKFKSLVRSAISYTVDHEHPQERFIGCLLCIHHWREVGPLKNSRCYLLHSSEADSLIHHVVLLCLWGQMKGFGKWPTWIQVNCSFYSAPIKLFGYFVPQEEEETKEEDKTEEITVSGQ